MSDKFQFGEQLLIEFVGAVCDRQRANTVRPYNVNVRPLDKLEFGGKSMVERANISDIAALTALRLEFLQEDCG